LTPETVEDLQEGLARSLHTLLRVQAVREQLDVIDQTWAEQPSAAPYAEVLNRVKGLGRTKPNAFTREVAWLIRTWGLGREGQ
jgi:hypothetical protein